MAATDGQPGNDSTLTLSGLFAAPSNLVAHSGAGGIVDSFSDVSGGTATGGNNLNTTGSGSSGISGGVGTAGSSGANPGSGGAGASNPSALGGNGDNGSPGLIKFVWT